MQTRNIGRFLQKALPEEMESLRIIRLDSITTKNTQVWRSYLVPIDAAAGTACEFMIDMLWLLENEPPMLQFWTVASIGIPASSRPWLMRQIGVRNDRESIPLFPIEHRDGRLSLSAALSGEISAADVPKYTAPTPEQPLIEGFVESYERASEILLAAWRDARDIGARYRLLQ